MIAEALAALADVGIRIERVGPIIDSAPLGPSRRLYANSAAIITTCLSPPELLTLLQHVERRLGRRRGQRWGTRSIDLDIILWSGGRWRSRALTIPHPRWHQRSFVLAPMLAIAADWRDPVQRLHARHHAARLRR